jgi:hypothetical protein
MESQEETVRKQILGKVLEIFVEVCYDEIYRQEPERMLAWRGHACGSLSLVSAALLDLELAQRVNQTLTASLVSCDMIFCRQVQAGVIVV